MHRHPVVYTDCGASRRGRIDHAAPTHPNRVLEAHFPGWFRVDLRLVSLRYDAPHHAHVDELVKQTEELQLLSTLLRRLVEADGPTLLLRISDTGPPTTA